MDETTRRSLQRAFYNMQATSEVEVMGMREWYLHLPADERERFKTDIATLVSLHDQMQRFQIGIKLPYNFDQNGDDGTVYEVGSGTPEPRDVQDAIVLWEQSEGYIPD